MANVGSSTATTIPLLDKNNPFLLYGPSGSSSSSSSSTSTETTPSTTTGQASAFITSFPLLLSTYDPTTNTVVPT